MWRTGGEEGRGGAVVVVCVRGGGGQGSWSVRAVRAVRAAVGGDGARAIVVESVYESLVKGRALRLKGGQCSVASGMWKQTTSRRVWPTSSAPSRGVLFSSCAGWCLDRGVIPPYVQRTL